MDAAPTGAAAAEEVAAMLRQSRVKAVTMGITSAGQKAAERVSGCFGCSRSVKVYNQCHAFTSFGASMQSVHCPARSGQGLSWDVSYIGML